MAGAQKRGGARPRRILEAAEQAAEVGGVRDAIGNLSHVGTSALPQSAGRTQARSAPEMLVSVRRRPRPRITTFRRQRQSPRGKAWRLAKTARVFARIGGVE